MALATCFSAVLARWGGLMRLLLNITLFDRQPLHPAVGAMLADFTNILLLDTACDGDTVSNLARKNQLTFTEDWEHRHWSGVELLRELKRQQRYPTMPGGIYQQSGAPPTAAAQNRRWRAGNGASRKRRRSG